MGKVGRVGATGEAIVVKDLADDPAWLRRYQWAARAHISGLNIQPIKFKQEILGVLGIFTTIPTPAEGPAWLRIFADEIAGAIVNARAFEEIERLRAHLELKNTYLQEEVREARAFGDIIGQTASIQELLRQIELVAPTDASVLILGETGTGKELVAHEIHRLSRRADRPLIRVNCASVPRELYESEFFGHVKGAFTGAIKDRAGRFEIADGGTLFLDEIGRSALGSPEQAAARAPGKAVRAGGRGADAHRGCAHHRRHQPRPEEGSGSRPVPAGLLLPPERLSHPDAAPCASARRTSPCWPSIS